MAKSKTGRRVVLWLDLRITLEAVILNRLERIPTTRRQEWLRGLLVQGFLSEHQALRGERNDARRRPALAFKNWRVSESKKPVSPPEQAPAGVKTKLSQANTVNKPFAALGQVIG